MNEIRVSIIVTVDPDLTERIAATSKKHTDPFTGQNIPKKSEAYKIGYRMDGGRKLYRAWLTPESYIENIVPKLN